MYNSCVYKWKFQIPRVCVQGKCNKWIWEICWWGRVWDRVDGCVHNGISMLHSAEFVALRPDTRERQREGERQSGRAAERKCSRVLLLQGASGVSKLGQQISVIYTFVLSTLYPPLGRPSQRHTNFRLSFRFCYIVLLHGCVSDSRYVSCCSAYENGGGLGYFATKPLQSTL